MSKASEWVAAWRQRDFPRNDPMGWHCDPPRPRWGVGDENALAYVVRGEQLQIGDFRFKKEDAISLARWIIDTFGEEGDQ